MSWIGSLRHEITIEQVVETQDSNGIITEEWVTYLVEWARVNPLSGTELFRARQLDATLSHEVWMRWRAGIRPKMRVKFISPEGTTHYFDIESVIDPDYRNVRLQLLCKELEVA
jgi:SPP1 family predicted phage head-tail adaptor